MGLLTPSHSLAFLIALFHENSRANRTHVQFYRFNRLWRFNASRRNSGVTFTHIEVRNPSEVQAAWISGFGNTTGKATIANRKRYAIREQYRCDLNSQLLEFFHPRYFSQKGIFRPLLTVRLFIAHTKEKLGGDVIDRFETISV